MQPLVIQIAKAIQEGASYDDVTRDCIFAALILSGGNKDQAAKKIGVDPRTLRSKMDRYGFDSFKKPDPAKFVTLGEE
jgi:DNA-binding NtrC family response regulator